MISTMIEIIEVECYFVVLNFNRLVLMRILFDFKIYFMLFTECDAVLKFCTQYNQC